MFLSPVARTPPEIACKITAFLRPDQIYIPRKLPTKFKLPTPILQKAFPIANNYCIFAQKRVSLQA